METTYYTVPARRVTVNAAPAYDENTPARELVCLRRQAPAPTGTPAPIIDFAAWKEEHPQQAPQASAPTRPAAAHTTPRRASLLAWLSERGEWVATLAVIGTTLLLMWRILVA